jgi:hypothetical protein
MSDSLRANDFMSTKTDNAEDVRSMPCSATRREYTADELKHWWVAECPVCKWRGLSRDAEGGHAMADTGDFNDVVCPVCIHTPEGKWMGRLVVVNEVESPNAKLTDKARTTRTPETK